MRTVDFHAHPVPASFRRWLELLGIDPMEDDGFPLPKWSAKEHLKFMDEAGIDHACLSLPGPHIHNGNDLMSLQAAVEINDEMSEICREHPDRFGWTACLPLPYVKGSIEEIRRCLDEKARWASRCPQMQTGYIWGIRFWILSWKPLMNAGPW